MKLHFFLGSSSRIQNRSILYPTLAHIPEKALMRPKFRLCLVSTNCILGYTYFDI